MDRRKPQAGTEVIYSGGSIFGQIIVSRRQGVVIKHLTPRTDLVDFGFSHFAWGYRGKLSDQLALAILCDAIREDDRALRIYQAFGRKVIARLPIKGWTLPFTAIALAVARLEDES